MATIFIDTNIILDLLLKRTPFYKSAESIFSLADKNKIDLVVSALSIANAHYIISSIKSKTIAREAIAKFKVLVTIVSLSDKIIELSLNDNKFPDFEDGLQYYSAIEVNCKFIITRDLKDFKNSNLPVMTADSYIAGL